MDDRTVDQFATDLRALTTALQDDAGDDELARQIERTSLRQWISDDDGMGHTHLMLDPIRHAELQTQVQAALARLCAEPGRTRSNQTAAQAMLQLVADGVNQPGRAPRPQVTVLVDAETVERGHHLDTVCETESGVEVPPAALDRFLCDADVFLALTGPDGHVDRLSAGKRTATAKQRKALRAMYPTCAHPGCDVSFDRCQIHHLDHWANGGPTILENLLPLCGPHHHLDHDTGWTYQLLPGRVLAVIDPNGVEHASTALPEPPQLPPGLTKKHARRRRTPPAEVDAEITSAIDPLPERPTGPARPITEGRTSSADRRPNSPDRGHQQRLLE